MTRTRQPGSRGGQRHLRPGDRGAGEAGPQRWFERPLSLPGPEHGAGPACKGKKEKPAPEQDRRRILKKVPKLRKIKPAKPPRRER